MEHLLFLEPVDVWSFRDGRPFEAGEAFDARSLFPPSPWTTLGCIRTALLRLHCDDVERYAGRARTGSCPKCGQGPCAAIPTVGPAGASAPFRAGPPLPARRMRSGTIEVLFRTPAHLVTVDGGTGPMAELLRPIDCPGHAAASLSGLKLVGRLAPGRLEPPPSAWLTAEELAAALSGEPPQLKTRGTPWLYQEPRIGIGMDYRRNTAKTGQLYVREVIRLAEDYGLAVMVDRPLDLDGEIGRLGGDGRIVRFRAKSGPSPFPAANPGGTRLLVYLASPARFAGGHVPELFRNGLQATWPGTAARVRLVACALAPAVSVGGWDLKRQAPRTMQHLVGAGSVFFLEVLHGDPAEVVRSIDSAPFCDDEDMARAGFGLAFVGRW